MSFTGNAESGYVLRGKLSNLEKINGLSAYEVAVANGFVGTEEEWLASLKGRDGVDGKDGTEIASFGRTAGSGLPGTKDTYTMNMSDGRNYQFDVYNGADGTGAGDMTATVYDQDGAVASEGGISSYVGGQIGTHNNDTAAHADIRAELTTKTNRNLLHNWYFANPVNQRGQTEYTAGYTIDRWFKHERGTIIVNDDSISVNDSLFRQIIENGIENICGKTCCFSVLTKDGELMTGFGSIPSNGGCEIYRANNVLLYTYADGNSVSVIIETQNGKVIHPVAAKLELGSTQTLAHQENGNWVLNEIPDYGEELRKCQRYQSFPTTWTPHSFLLSDMICFTVPTTAEMRTEMTPSNVILNAAKLELHSNGAAQSGFSFQVYGGNKDYVLILATKASHGLTNAMLIVNYGGVIADANL